MTELQERAVQVLARAGDDPAIEFAGHWHTWNEVRQVAGTVQQLIESSGAHPHAPVLLIARNVPAAIAAFLGLVASGRTIRMLYSFQSPAATACDIERLKPGVIVAAELDYSDEALAAAAASGAAAIALRGMSAELLSGLERSTTAIALDAAWQPIIEIQTSGTTGAPKRFPVSYDIALRQFAARPSGASLSDANPDSSPSLLYMSMGNLSGLMATLPALIHRRPMVLYDRFSLDGWRRYIRTYRPVHSGLQPVAIQMLLDANVPDHELSSLSYLTVGSAPLSPEVHRAFEWRYGISILLAYGATEFYGTVTAMTPALHDAWSDRKFGSVGRAVPGKQVRVVDEGSGAILAPGTVGILEVKAQDLSPNWVRTSDLGSIDPDGFLFMRGRADGAIIRGGFKLLPETIERGLVRHEAVAAAAVVGVADRRLGQVPAAAIQLNPGVARPDPRDLATHLRQHVLATHIPVYWRFVDDLPRNASLKVDRPAVARLFDDSTMDSPSSG